MWGSAASPGRGGRHEEDGIGPLEPRRSPALLVSEGVACALRRRVRGVARRRPGGAAALAAPVARHRPRRPHRPIRLRRASAGNHSTPTMRPRRSLVAIGGALSIFVVFALAMWAQLTIGWQWSPPNTVGDLVGHVRDVGGHRGGRRAVLAAAVPIMWSVGRDSGRGRAGRLLPPLLLSLGGIAVLVVGTHHFANGWPGTGGHAWGRQGIVPGGVAAYAWASTLFVTSYWAHPVALAGFPAAEVAWMVVIAARPRRHPRRPGQGRPSARPLAAGAPLREATDLRRHLGHGGLLHRRRHVGVRRWTGPAQPLPHRGDRPHRPRRHRRGDGGDGAGRPQGGAAPPAGSPPAEPAAPRASGVTPIATRTRRQPTTRATRRGTLVGADERS